MACNTYALAGISIDCSNIGGVSAIYVAPVEDVTGVTFSSGDTETISGITMSSTKKFKQYSFRRGNASATSTGTKDDAAGTIFYQTDVNMTFNRQDAQKRKELNELFKVNCYVIIKHNTGDYQLIGYDANAGGYASATTLTTNTGAQMGEANNYSLTLSAQTGSLPYHVLPTAIASII